MNPGAVNPRAVAIAGWWDRLGPAGRAEAREVAGAGGYLTGPMFTALTTAGVLTVTAAQQAWALGGQGAFPMPADVVVHVLIHLPQPPPTPALTPLPMGHQARAPAQ